MNDFGNFIYVFKPLSNCLSQFSSKIICAFSNCKILYTHIIESFYLKYCKKANVLTQIMFLARKFAMCVGHWEENK